MKRGIGIWLGLLGCGGWLALAAPERPLNGIAAIVNTKVITWEDVLVESQRLSRDRTLMRQYQLERRTQSEVFDALQQNSLEMLIEQELILNEFEKAGHQFPRNVVDSYIETQIREQYGNRVDMMKTLQEQGRTFESFRRKQTEEMIVRAMSHQNVSSSIMISPHKVETYYAEHQDQFRVEDQVHLRMIFLAYRPGRDSVQTRQMAEELLERLNRGVAFAELAAVYSDGSERAKGGDAGLWTRSGLREDLRDVAFSLGAGEFSGIIELDDGCHLLLVESREPAHVRPLGDVASDIEKVLEAQEAARLRKQWIDRLKAKAYVATFSGFAPVLP